MIDTPIIDTHLHLWDVDRMHYAWLDDIPQINRSFLLPDFAAATENVPIEKMVFLQCECDAAQALEEAHWVAQQAKVDGRLQGIVAFAPLEKGDAALDDIASLCEIPQVRGIRRIIQFEDRVDFCLEPDFIRGVQLLPEYNLSFDLCIKGDEQFRNTLELVRQCPDVPFVLDHIGKPFIMEGTVDPWSSYMTELAALPNTFCKVSGMVTEADMSEWTPEDLRPYLDVVFESFGFDRVMFGGDWPVCTQACSYEQWVQTLWQAVGAYSDDERAKLFYHNASKFYRL